MKEINPIFFDMEVYKNYILVAFKNLKEESFFVEINDNNIISQEQVNLIQNIVSKYTVISFNGINYDIPILSFVFYKKTPKEIQALSSEIINDRLTPFNLYKKYNIKKLYFNHIDLNRISSARGGLKILGSRINTNIIRELPINPEKELSKEEKRIIFNYCFIDLEVTKNLYYKLLNEIELRKILTEKYKIDLINFSNSQITEKVFRKELLAKLITTREMGISRINEAEITKLKTYKQNKLENSSFKANISNLIEFETEPLQKLLVLIKNMDFSLNINTAGRPKFVIPDKLKDIIIVNGDESTQYQMGAGGLHSKDKSLILKPTNDQYLIDSDVTSYYPFIVFNLKLSPKGINKNNFLTLLKTIIDERIFYKNKLSDKSLTKEMRIKYKKNSDSLKIIINIVYGKFNDIYSSLFSPEITIATTLNGQLFLLMLIEKLALNGIKTKSANTDGIVVLFDKKLKSKFEEITTNWEKKLNLILVHKKYNKIYLRDVNNYVGQYETGELKTKGCFGESTLNKNNQYYIVFKAVINKLIYNIPIEETIYNSKSVEDFIVNRKVRDGAYYFKSNLNPNNKVDKSKLEQGDLIGSVIRYYFSKENTEKKYYIGYGRSNGTTRDKYGDKVSNTFGAKHLKNLTEFDITDIYYPFYFEECIKIFNSLGLVYDL